MSTNILHVSGLIRIVLLFIVKPLESYGMSTHSIPIQIGSGGILRAFLFFIGSDRIGLDFHTTHKIK